MKLTGLAPLLAVLLLAACSTPEVAPTTAPPSTGYARGIDMATDSSDVVGELRGRPWLQFVARYYRDPASRWPALSPSEARRLAALGVKIVTVWEWHSTDPAYFTYATGYNDALNASRQAHNVGQPPGSAIYFAVDFNARGAALYQVDQYFRGVNAGLAAAGSGRARYKVGVYGSGAVCDAVRTAGLAHYSWLTGSTAWDGTAGYSSWNIRQAAQGARFANLSFSHDANEARNDYGAFQLGQYAENPAAEVVTAAAAAPAAAAALVTSAVTSVVPQPTTAVPPPPPIPAAAAPVAAPAPAPATQIAAAPPPAPHAPVPPIFHAAASPSVIHAAPAPLPPSPAPVRMARAEPAKPSGPAAEVAALAAAEPPAHERSAAHATHPAKEGATRHVAKEQAAEKHKVVAASASPRAIAAAAPLHHQAEAREPAHKASASRHGEERIAHVQTAKAAAAPAAEQHSARHGGEPHHPQHAHRTHEAPG